MTAARRLFCFGYGYSARALARRLGPRGWTVAGTCREAATLAALAGDGVEAHLFDRDHPLAEPAAVLAGSHAILISVPPDADGDPVFDCHGDDLAALTGPGGPAWIGYLSTTGVYGDRAGGWVDETSELRPSTERGRARLAAEQGWLELWQRHGLPVHLFRLAGIYGPGRSQLDAARAGRARRVVKPGQVFSRIHVDDIAQALAASIERPEPGAAYNLCDDAAAPPEEVVAYACELLGLAVPPPIPFDTAELSDMARSFYAESKRVRNDRMKRELGVELEYPTYREGLKALLYTDKSMN